MHVVAAPDKFRGTATAPQVASAIAAAVAKVGGTTARLPLADGGEGTLDAFGGPNRWNTVTGPLGEPVRAGWRMTDDGTAVIEMALASGLVLAGGRENNDAWAATTRGTGELVAAATAEGARRIIVGLGGSATTDGGFGALKIITADVLWSPTRKDPLRPELVVCCDVRTLFADAAEIFGPQKGADPAMVQNLRERLIALETDYLVDHGVDVREVIGGGAAGGLAGGLAVLGARLVPGFNLIAETLDLDGALEAADLVITGEGFLDHGSFEGKVVGGVIEQGRRRGIPVVVVVGDQLVPGLGGENTTVLNLVQRFGKEAAFDDTTGCIQQIVSEHLAGVSANDRNR